MPDFERITRQLAIDLAPNEQVKMELKAYHKGLDHARIECAIILSVIVIAVITVISV